MQAPLISAFFDQATNSVTYLIADEATKCAAIIDPVLDFDPMSCVISTQSADHLLEVVADGGLTVCWLLETHAHADHLSAGHYLKQRTGAKSGIGAGILEVQRAFGPRFEAEDVRPGGGDFDRLLPDGALIPLGNLTIHVLATPGHTPACVSYHVADAVFVGDTLFMPDYGTARCDFPGGDARQLYRSMHRILGLPRETRLFMCHDYKAPDRDQFAWETTVGEQLDGNIHLCGEVAEEDYVVMREARDATLKTPKLLYPAIQVNIRGGRLPPRHPNGNRYLQLPLDGPEALLGD